MNQKRLALAVASALSTSLLLAACGGGGGGSAGSSPAAAAAPTTGIVNVAVVDGVGDNYSHVWVTVTQIAFHANADQVWSSSDATWQTYTLPAPVTVDLANLTNGALNQVFNNLSLPTGTYKQIRLFLAAQDATLTNSAQSAGLLYNDQVDYSDSSGTVHHVPLEIAYPVQGMQLTGTFTVSSGSPLSLAIDFNLEQDVVQFTHGNEYWYTLRPNLSYFDLSASGAVTGTISPSLICSGSTTSGCGYNFVIKAEVTSSDGTRHVTERATTPAADGTFALFPLHAGTSVDVLIRGRNVDTALVRGVPVVSGTTPASNPTVLSTSPIAPVLGTNAEYLANFNTPLNPTSGWAVFQQTLPGEGELPYEVRWINTNPYTGLLPTPTALSDGPLHVAPYVAGGVPNFATVTPQEGLGGFSVGTNSVAYYGLSPNVAIAAPAGLGLAGTTSPLLTFSENNPTLSGSVTAGAVSGNLVVQSPGTYDSGYLVLTRFADIMTTVSISSLLTSGGGTGGNFQATLPAGSAAHPVPGAYYYAYVVVWNSASPLTTRKIVPVNGFIDLRSTSTVTGFNVTL